MPTPPPGHTFGLGFTSSGGTGGRRPPRIEIDTKAINRYFTTDPGAQQKLGLIALEYLAVARQASPTGRSMHWGKFKHDHGMFKRAFHVRKFRGGYRVYNRDPFAHLVEYGSVNNPVYAPMRRALRAVAAGRAVINPAKETGVRAVEGQHTF